MPGCSIWRRRGGASCPALTRASRSRARSILSGAQKDPIDPGHSWRRRIAISRAKSSDASLDARVKPVHDGGMPGCSICRRPGSASCPALSRASRSRARSILSGAQKDPIDQGHSWRRRIAISRAKSSDPSLDARVKPVHDRGMPGCSIWRRRGGASCPALSRASRSRARDQFLTCAQMDSIDPGHSWRRRIAISTAKSSDASLDARVKPVHDGGMQHLRRPGS